MKTDLRDIFARAIGWRALILHGDPPMLDRWFWLRRRLTAGAIRTLDAGSGSGAFAIFAATRGNEVVGVSFDAVANDKARRRAELLGVGDRTSFVDLDLRELGRDGGSFAQVICLEVIEHVADDDALAAALAALLEPGGRLLLTTPHVAHPGLLGERVSDVEDGGHVRWGYTEERLRTMLDAVGLDVVEVSGVSGILSQQLTNGFRLFNQVFPRLGWAVTLPLRPLLVLDRPLTRLLRRPWLSIAVVAVKRG